MYPNESAIAKTPYLSAKNMSYKVRDFIDFIVDEIGTTPYWKYGK